MVDPGPLGTTCARVGCMPSKLLIAAAEAAHEARHAGVFGVHADVRVDGVAVLERVRRERDRFVGFVLEATDAHERAGRLVRGKARFVEPTVLEVDGGLRIEARSVVVATGSSTWIPDEYRDLGDRLLVNDTVFELPDLPESLLVVGTGVIGLELGQAMSRLGVRVTLLGRRRNIAGLRDPKVVDVAHEVFKSELDLQTQHVLHDVSRVDGGVRVRFRDDAGNERDEIYEYVLSAAGRRPNLEGLGLDGIGACHDERGRLIIEDHTLQVGSEPVFIAGDVSGLRPLLHEAADEGRIAGENAARWPDILPGRRRVPLKIVFSQPNIAVVGHGWEERGRYVCAGEVDYGRQGRARCMNQHSGWVRLYARRDDGCLTGAEMFGPRVEHMAHLVAWAIENHLTVDHALTMPFYHPVVEEGLRTALRDLQKQVRAERSAVPVNEVGS